MIRAGFTLIMWGLIVVAVDVTLGGAFDVLVDPIGYGMIASALLSLRAVERSFATAQGFAVAAIPLSILQLASGPSVPLTVAGAVVEFFLIWYLCTGVIGLAVARGNHALSALAANRRTLVFFASAAGLTLTAVASLAPALAALVAIPTVVFAVIVLLLMLLLLQQAARDLAS